MDICNESCDPCQEKKGQEKKEYPTESYHSRHYSFPVCQVIDIDLEIGYTFLSANTIYSLSDNVFGPAAEE